jgi:WD domain, G-beta repeat
MLSFVTIPNIFLVPLQGLCEDASFLGWCGCCRFGSQQQQQKQRLRGDCHSFNINEGQTLTSLQMPLSLTDNNRLRGYIDPVCTVRIAIKEENASAASRHIAEVSSVCFLPASVHHIAADDADGVEGQQDGEGREDGENGKGQQDGEFDESAADTYDHSIHDTNRSISIDTSSKSDSDSDRNTDGGGSSSSEESELNLRCGTVAFNPKDATRNLSVRDCLKNQLLAVCTVEGDTPIWDLGSHQRIGTLASNRGPGLSLSRVADKISYHTRDLEGTVSLYDPLHSLSINHDRGQIAMTGIASIQTASRTFCKASPCQGQPNLVGLPSEDDQTVTVRDWRVPPTSSPVVSMHAALGVTRTWDYASTRKYGMLTSIAFLDMSSVLPPASTSTFIKSLSIPPLTSTCRPVLACGMENGSIYYHDLAMTRSGIGIYNGLDSLSTTSISLTQDPVLSLDMANSELPSHSTATASTVTIAGLASDILAQGNLSESERGTVALVKSTLRDGQWSSRIRARLATCSINEMSAGKPGVNLCRFRPDGRIFAVGGWDKRLRIFSRISSDTKRTSSSPSSSSSSSGSLLAILKAHTASVSAVDWAPDADKSGLLATGASDGQVCVWQCFAS